MSRYHRDDGSFATGMFTAAVIVAAFVCGFALGQSGFKIQITQPIQQEVKQ